MTTLANRATELLRLDSGTLGYWTTWQGNQTWFNRARDISIAYRVVKGIAVVLIKPFSGRKVTPEDIQEFLEFCNQNDLTPAFYASHEPTAKLLEQIGWATFPVGHEALFPLKSFNLAESQWRQVRHALNRAKRLGISAEWAKWNDLTVAEQHQITVLSGHWESRKRVQGMGFTLGGLHELAGPDVQLMIARNSHGNILAVTSWLPVYRNNSIVGWTLDFMRRSENVFNGINEFLIGSSASLAIAQGMEILSLSGVPVITHESGRNTPRRSVRMLLLSLVTRRLDEVYGFNNLYFFKKKFNPHLRPIYLACESRSQVPKVVIAVARAYLPNQGFFRLMNLALLSRSK